MSRKVAFSGVLTGIAVVLLYLSVILPTGKLTLYFLASLPIAAVIVEFGAGAGISVYFAACILSVLLSGNIPGIIPFIFLFGHYPILKYYIERGRRILTEILLKLAVFNLSLLLWYLFFKSVFVAVLPAQLTQSGILTGVFIALLQIIFFIYDYVFSRLLFYYESKLGIVKRN